jgi:hypothetical protein
MDATERQAERSKSEQQLKDARARLDNLRSDAQQWSASAAQTEIDSLSAICDRIGDDLEGLANVDDETFAARCGQVQEEMASLSAGIDTADQQMSGYDQMGDDRKLDVVAGQLGSAVEIIIVRLSEEASDDADFGEAARDDLRAAMQDASNRQRDLHGARDERRGELRRKLEEAVNRLKERVDGLVAKLKVRRERQATEQRV